jgi:hypothetical protein
VIFTADIILLIKELIKSFLRELHISLKTEIITVSVSVKNIIERIAISFRNRCPKFRTPSLSPLSGYDIRGKCSCIQYTVNIFYINMDDISLCTYIYIYSKLVLLVVERADHSDHAV